jgi:outer membrane lipoprotein-sorting protein
MNSMSIFDRKPVLRWVTPLAFVAIVGGTTGILATATAEDTLPAISAEDLLVKVQQAKVDTLSGTVVQDSNLGLPSLPGVASNGASLTSLLSGTHTLGVWYAGPDKSRLQVQGTNDETDVIVNGKDVWQWSYKDNKATHRTLTAPTDEQQKSMQSQAPADLPKTPEEAAQRALAAIAPTTQVTTEGSDEVAGIKAYELVLTPKDSNSLVTQVKIAVDGTRFIPLRVQVLAGQPDPVFQVAYSNISFDRPDDAQFTFKAPPGAEVKEVAPKADRAKDKLTAKELKARKAEQAAHADDVKVVGQGWSSVVVSKTDQAAGQAPAQLGQVLNALPQVSGTWGKGRLLSSAAFSAVITDDGRVAVGSVKPELLYDALAK